MYVDPSGQWFFSALLPGIGTVIDAALWGATIGGAVSGATYLAMSYAYNQPITLGGFGKAFGIGALGGAISGGISSIGGLVGNQFAFGVLGQVSSYAATTAIQGNPITLNGLIGLGVSGAVNGAIPGFQGIEGGNALDNVISEMAYDSFTSGLSRGVGSGVEASLNGKDFWDGFGQGFASGMIGGGFQSLGKIALLGRANPPTHEKTKQALANAEVDMDNQGKSVGIYKPTFRTGGLYKELGPKNVYGRPRGIALGSSLLVGDVRQENYLHEMAHYYQMQQTGYGAFLGRGAYEQWIMQGLQGKNIYGTFGTQEYGAVFFMKRYFIR